MEAIVLAGGMGTRLRPVVADRPKPLAPVAGRPFLAILLDYLRIQGVRRVVLAVGYRHEMIRDAFGDAHGGMELAYSIEAEPLGTGGAIRLGFDAVRGATAFIVNGDTFLELDYGALAETHRRAGALLTVAAARVEDRARYGGLVVENGRLAGFLEKGVAGPGLINAGVYCLERAALRFWPSAARVSFETEVLAARLNELAPGVFEAQGRFIDIGVPEDFERAQTMLAES